MSADGERLIDFRVVEPTVWHTRGAFEARYGTEPTTLVEQVFGGDWLRTQRDGLHPVAAIMSRPEPWPPYLTRLADLADLLACVDGKLAAESDLVPRLRAVEEFESAVAELRVARLLAETGLAFSVRAKSQQRGPDLDVLGPVPFAIEVKHVRGAARVELHRALTSLVHILPTEELDGHRVTIDWRASSEVLAIDIGRADWRTHALAVAAEVAPVITETIRVRGAGTYDFVVGDVRVRVESVPKAPGFEHRVSFEIATAENPHPNEARLVGHSGHLRHAAQQLEGVVPGILAVVTSPGVLCREATLRELARAFTDDGADMSHVVGAMVLLVVTGEEIEESRAFVGNPHSSVSASDLGCPRLFEAAEWVRGVAPIE